MEDVDNRQMIRVVVFLSILLFIGFLSSKFLEKVDEDYKQESSQIEILLEDEKTSYDLNKRVLSLQILRSGNESIDFIKIYINFEGDTSSLDLAQTITYEILDIPKINEEKSYLFDLSTYPEIPSSASVSPGFLSYGERIIGNITSEVNIPIRNINIVGDLIEIPLQELIPTKKVESEETNILTKCNDGIDNDHDGHIDLLDLGCEDGLDTEEYSGNPFCYEQDGEMLLDVDVEIFEVDGHESFNVYYEGDLIRNGSLYNKLPYKDFSDGNLDIDYKIERRKGGFDIVYSISNPTSPNQALPELFINGIHLNKRGLLEYFQHSSFNKRGLDKFPAGSGGTNIISRGYPNYGSYSPLIISIDDEYAIGSSLQFDFVNYSHDAYLFLNADPPTSYDIFRHVYGLAILNEESRYKHANISSGETRNYNLSVRFSKPDKYIFTACPYKKYFHEQYGVEGNIQERDTSPVQLYHIAYGNSPSNPTFINPSNPRGYDPSKIGGRLDLEGWGPFVNNSVSSLKSRNVNRAMIWLAHGGSSSIFGGYYPLFMSFWLPELQISQEKLRKYEENGIKFGYWWQRSYAIPSPIIWNAPSIYTFDYKSEGNVSLFNEQLDLAEDRYAKEIGLDAIVHIPFPDRLIWVKMMKERKPDINFIHESEGADLMHNEIANFYHPTDKADLVNGPDLLSWYLNPSKDEWFYNIGTNYRDDQTYSNRIRDLMSWGYTPLMAQNRNLSSITYPVPLIECLNGIDDDSDGLVDIYDPDCSNELDNSE